MKRESEWLQGDNLSVTGRPVVDMEVGLITGLTRT